MISSYKYWHLLRQNISKSSKYTLGEKTETLFLEVVELIFAAQYVKQEQKLPTLQKASIKFDTLKFFLQILWEMKDISNKHYELLSKQLNEIGRMLGGWLKQAIKQNSPAKAGEK